MGKSLEGKELGVGISQRKGGLYQARFTDRFGNRKTIYNYSLKELRKKLSQLITDDSRGCSLKKDYTVDEWYKKWFSVYKENHIKENTKRYYSIIYRINIYNQIGLRRLTDIRKSDVQLLIENIKNDGYGYERQLKARWILQDMFQRAVEDDLIVKNPVSGIKLLSKKSRKSEVLTVQEQKDFLAFSKGTFYDNLFNVAINTGLRPGELFALTIDDVDLDENVIHVTKTLVYQKYLNDKKWTFHVEEPKTATSNRIVPINSLCRLYLLKQINQKEVLELKYPSKSPFLFTTAVNTPLSSQLYSSAIKTIVKKINMTRDKDNQFKAFTGHTFRHTFATRCFENGIEAKVVQSYLGHASLKMTMDLYTHVTNEKSFLDIEKICNIRNISFVDKIS